MVCVWSRSATSSTGGHGRGYDGARLCPCTASEHGKAHGEAVSVKGNDYGVEADKRGTQGLDMDHVLGARLRTRYSKTLAQSDLAGDAGVYPLDATTCPTPRR